MQPIAFDAHKTAKLHCHFLQSLVNIQMKALGAPLLPDLASLRCLLAGDRTSDFLPIATILGALQTFALVKVLQAKRNEQREYRLTLPSLTNGGGGLAAYSLEPRPLEAPLQVKSLALEATRGGPLRVVPENFTAWSKINVPLSSDLQSVDAIVQFIQVRLSVSLRWTYSPGSGFFGGQPTGLTTTCERRPSIRSRSTRWRTISERF